MAVLLALAAYWAAEQYNERRARERDAAHVKLLESYGRATGQFQDMMAPRAMQVVDKAFEGFASTYRPGPSAWEASEKARHAARLPTGAFDILPLPIQVEGYAFGRASRSLMSARLSQALMAAGQRVPDPWVVLQALGENQRQLDPEDAFQLAERLGVKRILWVFAGHDRQGHMSLAFRVQEKRSDGAFNRVESFTFERFAPIPVSDDAPALVAFEARIPEILGKMGYTPSPQLRTAGNYDGALPAAPKDLVAKAPDPARDACSFLLLAALAPESAERLRERFVEKALLAADSLPGEHPDARLLRSRALMLMGLRPAALKALGTPTSDAESQLFALLNGNLPEMASATARIRPGAKRLLAELDLMKVRFAYETPDRERAASALQALPLPDERWQMLVMRAMADGDTWAQFDNLSLKAMLDEALPIAGFTAEGIATSSGVLPQSGSPQHVLDMSVHDHLARLPAETFLSPCCSRAIPTVSQVDFLELLSAIASDNLFRRVDFLNSIQGRPQDAMAALNGFEATFKDHPHVSLLRAEVEAKSAEFAKGTARDALLRSAYTHAFDALYREKGQTRDATRALELIGSLQQTGFGHLQNYFVDDAPARPNYPKWDGYAIEGNLKRSRDALANATYESKPLFDINWIVVDVMHKNAEFEEDLKRVNARFSGNVYVGILKANAYVQTGDVTTAERHFRAAIGGKPTVWEPYNSFAEFLLFEGRVEESAGVARSYPGFSPKYRGNPVGVANDAYEAGSRYYWVGRFDLSSHFYELAAKLNTGAASSITSATRLRLLAGDLSGALAATYERAQRYNLSYAYRDYLGFLHAMGYTKEAWDAFDVLARQMQQPEIWETALVGHRMAGATEQEVLAWVNRDHLRNAGTETSYAAAYFLRSAATDRVPSASAADTLASLDRKLWKVADGYDHVVRTSLDPQIQYVLGPSAIQGFTLPQGALDRFAKSPVRSDLSYFAEAYRHMKGGDNGRARLLFEEAAALYDTSQPALGYLLPYFAIASARSGDTAAVEKELAQVRVEQQRLDYFLARAALAAIAGKGDEAAKFLGLAKYRRPFTETRPLFPEYVYVDVVELLHEATGKSRYRDIAIEWARVNQQLQPWVAWPYAVEAKLGPDGAARRRAIAMASYLDPGSSRLSTLPKRKIQDARQEFSRQNPFQKMKENAREDAT